MSFSVNEAGELVELQEVPVNEAELEAQLQAELDAAQNEVNVHASNLANAEENVSNLEAQLEQAETERDQHEANKEAAEERLQKSVARRDSWESAKQLRQEQLDQAASEGIDDDTDGAEEDEATNSEAVDVPVSVVASEGAAG